MRATLQLEHFVGKRVIFLKFFIMFYCGIFQVPDPYKNKIKNEESENTVLIGYEIPFSLGM